MPKAAVRKMEATSPPELAQSAIPSTSRAHQRSMINCSLSCNVVLGSKLDMGKCQPLHAQSYIRRDQVADERLAAQGLPNVAGFMEDLELQRDGVCLGMGSDGPSYYCRWIFPLPLQPQSSRSCHPQEPQYFVRVSVYSGVTCRKCTRRIG